MADLEKLFDNLLATVSGKAAPMVTAPTAALPAAPAASRCSMCGLPGANHAGPVQCVGTMRVKLAALTNDPGMLPVPTPPPRPFSEVVARAHARWLAKPQEWRREHPWSAPRLPSLTP